MGRKRISIILSHHILQLSSGARPSGQVPSMAISRIVSLATAIVANTTKLNDYLEENKLALLSFDADAPLMYQLPRT